jgi:ABC-type thiamine transport system ATPase subunit
MATAEPISVGDRHTPPMGDSESGRPAWAEREEQIGDPKRFGIFVDSATIAGTLVTLPGPGVTAIVGANNVGKSTLLRNLQAEVSSPGSSVSAIRLVTDTQSRVEGDMADFKAWLGRHSIFRPANPLTGESSSFSRGGFHIPVEHVAHLWEEGSPDNWPSTQGSMRTDPNSTHQRTKGAFIHTADVMSRFQEVAGTPQRPDATEAPGHALHFLQDDAMLRKRLNDLCEQIFRTSLTLDSASGTMRLRVGLPDVTAPTFDQSQSAYRASLGRLPMLEAQGDGMRSLLGLLLPLIVASYPLVFVDEPEAFLHPPQAFQLGRVLGQLADETRTQIVLATHDRNLLAGLLNSGVDLSVIRLSRQGNTTTASQLSADELKILWTDPVLRYSNVLDGLFHRLVVLAEAERDCTFYAAALDHANQVKTLDVAPSDVLFVPSHGKHGMVRLATALRAAGVPVVASPDIDLLNDKVVVTNLVAALGQGWGSLDSYYDKATAEFRAPRQNVTLVEARTAMVGVINDLLDADDAALLNSDSRQKILNALRVGDNPWQKLKEFGAPAFKQAPRSARALLDGLRAVGVALVEAGELERLAPLVKVAKSKGWLLAALESKAHEEKPAQDHIARILEAGHAVGL